MKQRKRSRTIGQEKISSMSSNKLMSWVIVNYPYYDKGAKQRESLTDRR